MTTAAKTAKTEAGLQLNVTKELTTATLNGTKVEITPESAVTVFSNQGVETKPATDVTVEDTEGFQIGLSKNFNTVAANGAQVSLKFGGELLVATDGKVQIKPAAEVANSAEEGLQLNVANGVTTLTLSGKKVEITSIGDVTVYTNDDVQRATAPAEGELAADNKITVGKNFDSITAYNATIETATDGGLAVTAASKVQIKHAEEADALKAGTALEDGTVFVGKRADGTEVFVAGEDVMESEGKRLSIAFNDAAKQVAKLNKENYLGHNDWRIPTEEELDLIHQSRNKKDLGKTFDELYNVYYMSSTSAGHDTLVAEDLTSGRKENRRGYHTSRLRLVR